MYPSPLLVLVITANLMCFTVTPTVATSVTSSAKQHHVRLPPHPVSFVTTETVSGLREIEQQLTPDCRRDAFHFLQSATRTDISVQWALEMIDSWGVRPTGYISNTRSNPLFLVKKVNQYYSHGNYERCLQSNSGEDTFHFTGKYCPVTLVDKYYGDEHPVASIGHCFPSTCSSSEIATVLEHLYRERFNVSIDGDFCTVSGENKVPLSTATVVTLAILVAVGILVIAGTYMESRCTEPRKDESVGKKIVLAFSLVSNTNSVTDTRLKGDSFTCLDGIRFLNMAFVILHHAWLSPVMFPSPNVYEHYMDLENHWIWHFHQSGNLAVDAFFLLSGLLLTFFLMARLDKSGGVLKIKQILLNRYLRITPTYVMVLLVFTNIVPYLGDGPYWQVIINQTKTCSLYWWGNIFHVNNLLQRNYQCRTESWYLAADMQLYIFAIFITYVLWKKPQHAKKILLSLIALFTSAVSLYILYIGGYDHMTLLSADMDFYLLFYSAPFSHVSASILGVATGYILYCTKGIKEMRFHKSTVILGWILSILLMAFALLGSYECLKDGLNNCTRKCFILHHGLRTLAFSLSLSWVTFMCIKGYGGFVNVFLSNRCFRILSRLGYTGYLVSFIVQQMFLCTARTPFYSDGYTRHYLFITILVLCLGVGFVFTLLFEMPFARVVKILQSDKQKKG